LIYSFQKFDSNQYTAFKQIFQLFQDINIFLYKLLPVV